MNPIETVQGMADALAEAETFIMVAVPMYARDRSEAPHVLARISSSLAAARSLLAQTAASRTSEVQAKLITPPTELLDRVKAAEQRVQDNRAPRSIPADPRSDVDLVLAEVRYWLEGNWPPFWIAAAPAADEGEPNA